MHKETQIHFRIATFILLIAQMGHQCGKVAGQEVALQPPPHTQKDRLSWWRDARFGLFIHWGLYAIPGRGEWVQWNEQIPVDEYAKLAAQFDPKNFDADAWAELAKEAGTRYVVLTARHHDGFCLFNDGKNPFTSVNTAARRDFVAEYVQAVRRAGLRVGLYYSPLDWRYPGFFFPDLQRQSAEEMRANYHRQVNALLSNYGQIDVLWFDGGEADWLNFGADWQGVQWRRRSEGEHYRGGFRWQHEKVYENLRRLQPEILINNRADMPEDFYSREHAMGEFDNRRPWEYCTTLAGAWGYQPNQSPRPLKECIHLLANTAGRDGNFLLNVGPQPDGQVDPAQAQRLLEIGQWLKRYGESIYSTRGGPFFPGEYGTSTHRDTTVYLHVLTWPGEKLRLPPITAKVLRVNSLTGGKPEFTQSDEGLEIIMPHAHQNDVDTIIMLQLDSLAANLQPVAVP